MEIIRKVCYHYKCNNMNIVKYYKATSEERKKLFSQNRDIINAYNLHILKILLFFSVAVCFVLSVLSLIPAIEYLYQFRYQVFFSISLCVFFAFAVLALFAGVFVGNHSVAAMYTYIVLVDIFSVGLNLLSIRISPYTVTIGFLILAPILMLDSRARVIIINGSVLLLCLALSYYYKTDECFLTDCINCVAFSAVGVLAGDRFRINNIRLLDLKEHELDRNIEVLRAKNEARH